jgi:hypothetical protein
MVSFSPISVLTNSIAADLDHNGKISKDEATQYLQTIDCNLANTYLKRAGC